MTGYVGRQMTRKAAQSPVRAACRNDLIAARRRLYAAAKACDAALKLDTDAMIEAAAPLVAAARMLPDE